MYDPLKVRSEVDNTNVPAKLVDVAVKVKEVGIALSTVDCTAWPVALYSMGVMITLSCGREDRV